MPDQIYIVVDHAQNKVRSASWESLAMGQRLAAETGKEAHALVLGNDPKPVAEQVAAFRFASVRAVADERLAEYDPDCYTAALTQALADQAELAIFAHTYQNIDLLPKLAAAMNTALVTECIGYRRDDAGRLIFVRQMFRSKLNADVSVSSPHPWLISVQAGAFSADTLEKSACPIVEPKVDLSGVVSKRKTVETIQAAKGKVDLTRAEVIVGVGRGIKKPENLPVLKELADALGGEIGASRPVVDNEWLERERQIGSSGQTVTPKLYVACGISGAIQHIVGMKNSGCIVAINTDPNAPIFNVATYGVVGDILEVAPALAKRIRQEKGQ
jgi:electron transfer flavoprotein alpha subunit